MAKSRKIKSKKKPAKAKKTRVMSSKKKTVSKKTKKVKKPSKSKKVQAIPEGYLSITPCLVVSNGNQAIEFYKNVFGAKLAMRLDRSDGKIGHAELKIGNCKIMLADECPEMGAHSPNGDPSNSIYLYIKDVDTTFERALSNGAKIVKPVENMFYGDRAGLLEDPYGHRWFVATHVENVPPATIKKRAAELFGS